MNRALQGMVVVAYGVLVIGCGSQAPHPEQRTTTANNADTSMPGAAGTAATVQVGGSTTTAGSGGSSEAGPAAMPVASSTPMPMAMSSSSGAAGTEDKKTPAPPAQTPTQSECDAGFTSVHGKCVCDLNGTFALHGRLNAELSGLGVETGSDAVQIWGLVHPEYKPDGKLVLSLALCGQAFPDMCSAGFPPLVNTVAAFGQYAPAKAWEKSSPPVSIDMGSLEAAPNASFATPVFAQVLGMSLTDPLGMWPGTRKDIEGGPDFDGSSINGARWLDLDGDGQLGVTNYVVPPGGVAADSGATAPLQSYGATSSVCPRSNAQAERSPYAYLPIPDGLQIKRVKRYFGASRVVVSMKGALDGCDRIAGDLAGPEGGKIELNALIAGCVYEDGSNETACETSVLALFEGSGASIGLSVDKGTFVMKRVADDVSCAQVRKLTFE